LCRACRPRWLREQLDMPSGLPTERLMVNEEPSGGGRLGALSKIRVQDSGLTRWRALRRARLTDG